MHGPKRTAGYVATAMMALAGAGFFLVFLLEDLAGRGDVHWSDLPLGLAARYILSMGIGGALAGWLLAGLFGRSGVSGWLAALLGGALAVTVAGLLGSLVGLLPDLLADGWQTGDLIAIVYGLVVLPLAFVGQPLVLLLWLALVAATHLWARHVRA